MNSIVVATNVSYDWAGVFGNEPEEMQFRLIMRGSRMLRARSNIKGDGTFFRESKQNHHATHAIEFWDTLNFSATSVEELGNLLGIPKMEKPTCFLRRPENEQEWTELEAYNMRDAKISKMFLEHLRQYLAQINIPLRMTIASCAMSHYRINHLNDILFQPDKETLREQFKCYYGGRVEVITRGELFDLHYYDVNSLYPYVMSSNDFPDPNSMKRSGENTHYFIDNYEGYSDVAIYCPQMDYPLLPYRTEEKRLLFPCGELRGYYTHIELRRAKELGYTIRRVHTSVYYTKTMRPFIYLKELYDRRIQHKKAGEHFMAALLKLLLNSTYGKFGQRFDDMDVFEPFNLTLEEIRDMAEKPFERVGNYYRTKEDCEPAPFCIPIWAAYVTAYGRILIHDLASKNHAHYLDTDSIMVKNPIKSGDGFGELKYEGAIKRAIFVRPKFYVLDHGDHISFKIKGVSLKQLISLSGTTQDRVVYDDMKR
jgi:DNA polymerase elongation subunit (family B)